jgi:putative hydrolase of the HAD superfamily
MRFKAVVFDVDGTLYPASALNAAATPLVLAHPALFAAFGAARRRIRGLERSEGYRRNSPADGAAFRRRQAELAAAILRGRLLARSGADPTAPDAVERLESRIADLVYGRIPELFARLAPYPGLPGALDRLAAAGMRLAVLSDLPPARKLELFGFAERFEAALCTEDSGFLKPSPEAFYPLRLKLGLEFSEMLYVGDSRDKDLAGARGVGMAAAIVSRRRVGGASLSFFDWDELAEFALR